MDAVGSVTIVGRIERIPWRRVARELARRRLSVKRHFASDVRWLVVGHGALSSLRSGRLQELLSKAEKNKTGVLSEHRFLRELDLMGSATSESGNFDIQYVARLAQLEEQTLRLLVHFDILECDGDRFTFQDVHAAKAFCDALRQNELVDVIARALEARRTTKFTRHIATLDFSTEESAGLPLGDDPQSFDDAWESAIEAMTAEALEDAELSFRRCAEMRPRDASCFINLAFAYERLGKTDAAKELLRRATIIEPGRTDAWADLAHLSSGPEKLEYLRKAHAADPSDLPTLYDLADSLTRDERYTEALPFWEKLFARPETEAILVQAQLERAKKSRSLCNLSLRVPGRNVG